jgi:hypothetical protein
MDFFEYKVIVEGHTVGAFTTLDAANEVANEYSTDDYEDIVVEKVKLKNARSNAIHASIHPDDKTGQ